MSTMPRGRCRMRAGALPQAMLPQWEACVRGDSAEQRSGAVSTRRHTDVGPVDGDGAVVAAVAAAVSRRMVAESAGEPLLDLW